MLIQEEITIRSKDFIHTYSDKGLYILQNNQVMYNEAYDLKKNIDKYVYTETDIPIEIEEEEI